MKRTLPLLLLVLGGGAFALGLFELFKLRYAVGDVYPRYSSLRTDPLGTMIFYESLEQCPGLSVRRDFSANNQLPESRDTAYLQLAASCWDWVSLPEELFFKIEQFVRAGGRLIITFLPEPSQPFRFIAGTGKPTPMPKQKPGPGSNNRPVSPRDFLKERWGVEFGYVPLPTGDSSAYQPVPVIKRGDLPSPETLPWHSGMTFTNLANSWQIIYARGTNAVLIERKFGAGSVLMATDTYFVSNEAMAKERHADLLAWMIGPQRQVIFDEVHLGLMETPGISTLMRRYHLQALAVGLLVLAGLFFWKNASSLVPPYAEEEAPQEVAGKDASAGLVTLLRRNITPGDVLRVCFEQWTKSFSQDSGHSIARVDQAQAVLEAEEARAKIERNPVRAYQEISRILKGDRRPTAESTSDSA